MLDIKDIYYFAGLYEGEGSSEYVANSPRLAISQKNREILDKLIPKFGGTVIFVKASKTSERSRDCYVWRLGSNDAIALMMTIFSLMSTKRQAEFKNIILQWKFVFNKCRASKYHTHCIYGHEISPENSIYYGKKKPIRLCLACHLSRQEKKKIEYRERKNAT